MTRLDSRKRQEKGKNLAARYSADVSPETLHPYFSLQYHGRDYCLSRCQKDEKASFADTLHKLSKLTWQQIRASHRHQFGYEKIERNEIRAGIPPYITEDVNIIAFRFHKTAPMVGYRDRATFYVVWLDRDFSLYDHG